MLATLAFLGDSEVSVSFRQLMGLAALAALTTADLAAVAEAGDGAGLSVIVLDEDGEPVPNVAVVARPSVGAAAAQRITAPRKARMHQQDRKFVPHILIVERGTVVEFPNHDELLHHVYSFSEAKHFEIPLYGGTVSPELVFDRAGLVTIGCNIHDGMLGYILVVDTPYFAKTDASGEVVFDQLPAGPWAIETWTPRIKPDRLPAAIDFVAGSGSGSPLIIRFGSKLRPPHSHGDSSLTWDPY